METKTMSNKTFSNNSFQNWQSKRCDFCMYHELIFDQLERLKEAVIIKNQRIVELEQFIARLSQMAFSKTPMSQSTNSHTNFISPQMNESSLQFQNESLSSNQKVINPAYFKKKFQQSSEISFSDSKHNTAKFETKMKQNWPDMNSRLQKINELNEMKKQMNRKIMEASSKNQSKDSRSQSSVNSLTTNEYDTMRSLSVPQEEGHINSIADSSCENSRVKELSQRNNKFSELLGTVPEGQFKKSQSTKGLEQQSKNSMNIIKEYIKMLK